MSFWNFMTGGASGVIKGVNSLVGTVFGDKRQIETNIHSEQSDAMKAMAAENMQIRENRTWFDSLIDGLNRLPRPVIAFLVIGVFVYAPYDPIHFAIIMQSYSATPEWLAYLLMQVVLLFFGGRMLEKAKFGGPSKKAVKQMMDNIRDLEKMRDERNAEDIGHVSQPGGYKPSVVEPAEATDDIHDTSKPLSNDAILEWNRRNKK